MLCSCFTLVCNYLYVVIASPLILLGIVHVPRGIQEYLDNVEQLIDINSDEICMITQEYFYEGSPVEKCNQCKTSFSSDALQEWLKKESSQKQCIVCAYSYNSNHFTKGKAHMTVTVQPIIPTAPY